MKNMFIKSFGAFWLLFGLLGSFYANGEQAEVPGNLGISGLKEETAVVSSDAVRNMILSATKVGKKIIAVGDRGTILLSDDGVSFRQAKSVPTRATLTSVSFADDREGWAVGHWGVILHTSDGGENWTLQRDDLKEDRPLFAVWFGNKEVGFAAGLWSTLLGTKDGGASWQTIQVAAPASGGKADRNFYQIFQSGKGTILIAAEAGIVYRSTDGGSNWVPVETGSRGSFWTGISLKSGVILVGGLAGNLYRSVDDGKTWSQIDIGVRSSITDIRQMPDGKVRAVGLDGLMLVSDNDGKTFTVTQRDDRLSLTAMAINDNSDVVLFCKDGLVIQK